MSDYFKSTDSVNIFNCVLCMGIECFHISGVCCVAMVTSVLHPHCVCSLIKSVLNHVFITMYVPSHKVCYALLPWWNVCSSDSRCHAWRVNNPGNEIIPSRYAYLGWGLWGEPNQAAHWHQVCHSCQLQLGCSCQPLLAFSFPISPPPSLLLHIPLHSSQCACRHFCDLKVMIHNCAISRWDK